IQIPVCYDASLGLDLEELAISKKASIEEVIKLHTATIYRI
ncbi:MAG: carboxyltransferase domain-containing protein, partial [Pedobacter sp.]|nr:carboxyltransferase domain-containing protein [Chitinophagaceae bacterium]